MNWTDLVLYLMIVIRISGTVVTYVIPATSYEHRTNFSGTVISCELVERSFI